MPSTDIESLPSLTVGITVSPSKALPETAPNPGNDVFKELSDIAVACAGVIVVVSPAKASLEVAPICKNPEASIVTLSFLVKVSVPLERAAVVTKVLSPALVI